MPDLRAQSDALLLTMKAGLVRVVVDGRVMWVRPAEADDLAWREARRVEQELAAQQDLH